MALLGFAGLTFLAAGANEKGTRKKVLADLPRLISLLSDNLGTLPS
jgi:hypothetical protein